MERILGIDVGDKRIGVAVTDPLQITAQGVMTLKRKTRDDDLEAFRDLIARYEIKKVVAGLPLNMDGSESAQTRKTINFCQFIKKRLKIEIIYIDERLTSSWSEKVLIEGNVSRENRKDYIDMLAAQMILQSYMDRAVK
ncbi:MULTISPECIES: Holliday junction resolvase RuvX [Acetobacterium]|jgi:putative Holliday junction resolvase|uniref:Putative pre-16S rRNA nuclease n=1 Tax=Acetobacterium wieringae TaxID=52694 RepID=A0A1F2PHD8_9FIRM|nr:MULTISPECIES: Holliday junction resolvase RuvX [Acetobacterium]MEA4806805.1 Holliday junction resolvase RuvX [Acetobacterium wieringae]OFV70730.1 putative holliday junction resolvase [Acetobacterium wieringae]OXS27302.1 MAG: Holliday junction DNA helicase RuvA [Acetobacterium sp. MES1]TYC87841.1 Holliday junction resolvase RuvX [Acetobacterium wieringae]URN83639.1 Holliday junction resolvase RuvX [Acetobacterium wieringae]